MNSLQKDKMDKWTKFLHFLCKYAHIFERFANFQTKKMQKKSHLNNHPHHAGDRDVSLARKRQKVDSHERAIQLPCNERKKKSLPREVTGMRERGINTSTQTPTTV